MKCAWGYMCNRFVSTATSKHIYTDRVNRCMLEAQPHTVLRFLINDVSSENSAASAAVLLAVPTPSATLNGASLNKNYS